VSTDSRSPSGAFYTGLNGLVFALLAVRLAPLRRHPGPHVLRRAGLRGRL